MTYVYDLLLNFQTQLYEFYEWNKDDKIYHIKRINLVKISSTAYNEILDNNIKISDDFLLTIFNKCQYFDNRNVESLPYAILLTDTYRVMGVLFDIYGNIIKYSSLLLDEEEDILDISNRLAEIKLNYQIISKKEKYHNLTRMQEHIIKYIRNDLNMCYQKNDINKLKYLYYEYFNKNDVRNIDIIYNRLIKELENINYKHYNLYNLIKLSYTHKNV